LTLKRAHGDGRYIAAELIGGDLRVRWIGPNVLPRTAGASNDPLAVGSAAEGSETADAETWDRNTDTGSNGATVPLVSRVVYDHTGDKKLYAMVRTLTFDTRGALQSVSAEARVEVDAAESC